MLISIAQAKTLDEIIGVIQTSVLNPISWLLFALAAVVFLYGVVEFIAGASSEEARTKGKRHMIWGITGVVIMTAAQAIITVFKNFFGAL